MSTEQGALHRATARKMLGKGLLSDVERAQIYVDLSISEELSRIANALEGVEDASR